jgi:hypothetical protein
MWKVHRILVRKHVEKWPFGKLQRWKCEIKTDVKTEGLIFSRGGACVCLSLSTVAVLK